MLPTQLFTPPTPPMANPSFGAQSVSQLAEFASSMVYLMWHARKKAYTHPPPSLVGHDLAFLMWQARKPIMTKAPSYSPLGDPISHAYTASPAFKKFCYQVLTATQLKESAVYLSLKYIAILLQSNPSIEGAEGSEYRLFIVALMLANKFLDDNTFTNKTWSDVSGMKVHDLNIMEAEFLEALDYNLFVRQHQFDIWRNLLDECRQKAQLSYYDSPQQRQQLILTTLHTLGLSQTSNRYSLPDWQPHYQQQQQQQFLHPKPVHYTMPPVGYGYPITNLSQSSWDPLAYSLNRCQDFPCYPSNSSYHLMTTTRPISWRNYT
ncbi:cyclin-domain-containing protein [Choanephora cucurbitarum]|nr:cyclin-domain-containing protein [Choanephora cucurbitarum]